MLVLELTRKTLEAKKNQPLALKTYPQNNKKLGGKKRDFIVRI
jgi:hypothetical protein